MIRGQASGLGSEMILPAVICPNLSRRKCPRGANVILFFADMLSRSWNFESRVLHSL